IGVWENINHERVRPFKDMQVWDGISNARIRFNSDDSIPINKSAKALAWIIENHNIQHAILTKLAQSKDNNFDFLENTTIGADGINSVVRSFANIESLGWDYNARAVVATLQVDSLIENGTAWQRFLPTGPIALLPICKLPSNKFIHLVNSAFHLRIADLEYLYSQLENNEIDFAKEFEWRQSIEKKSNTGNNSIGTFPPLILDVQEKSRAEFPLKMRNAESYVKERIALIGDAAHTIHPLAGQGLNQGLADVQSLVKVIEHGVVTGQDLGNIQLLKNYSSDRYLSNLIMLGVVDKLHKLFGNDFAPIVLMRSLGLQVINNLEPVKKNIRIGGDLVETENNFFEKTQVSVLGFAVYYHEPDRSLHTQYFDYFSDVLSHDTLFVINCITKLLSHSFMSRFHEACFWSDCEPHYYGKNIIDSHFGVLSRCFSEGEAT
ncbi:13046_t:CDS:2, partial [Dentiscutata heterogama]